MTTPTAEAQRRLLGFGLRCDLIQPGVDIGRDVRLRPGPNGTDLAIVEGVDCLTQDLAVALTTLRGSDLLDVAFGFDGLAALAEETIPVVARERVRAGVVAVLNRDPRVRRIVDVKLADSRLDPLTAGSRDLDVRVTFELFTGERITVHLGGTDV